MNFVGIKTEVQHLKDKAEAFKDSAKGQAVINQGRNIASHADEYVKKAAGFVKSPEMKAKVESIGGKAADFLGHLKK